MNKSIYLLICCYHYSLCCFDNNKRKAEALNNTKCTSDMLKCRHPIPQFSGYDCRVKL